MPSLEVRLVRYMGPLFILAAASVFLFEPLSTGRLVAGLDIVSHIYPLRALTFSLLRSGELPSWNPYVFCGMPLLAQVQAAAFYPLNLLHLLLPTHLAINWSVFLHLVLAGLFTYVYLRRVGVGRVGCSTGALGYMVGALPLNYIYAGHIAHLNSIAWIPALFLTVHMLAEEQDNSGRPFVMCFLVIEMMLLGGHPQLVEYGLLCVFVYLLVQPHSQTGRRIVSSMARRSGLLASAVALGLIIGSVQLAPAIEFGLHSDRSSRLPIGYVSADSMPPEKMLTFLAPGFFGNAVEGNHWGRASAWESTAFVGTALLLLAPLSFLFPDRRTPFALGGVFLFSTLLAAGTFTPVFRVFYEVVPGFDRFRNPARFLAISSFALAALGGIGVDAACRNNGDTLKLRRGYAGGLLTLAGVLGLLTILPKFLSAESEVLRSLASAWGDARTVSLLGLTLIYTNAAKAVAVAALMCAVTAMILFVAGVSRIPLWFPKAALIVLLAADLRFFGHKFIFTLSPQAYTLPSDLVTFLKKNAGPYRVGMQGRFPGRTVADRAMLYELNNAFGYEAQIPGRYAAYLANVFPQHNHPLTVSFFQGIPNFESAALRLLGVRFSVRMPDEGSFTSVGYPAVYRSGEFSVYEVSQALPRAFVVANVIEADDKETLDLLRSDGFDPLFTGIVPEGTRLPFPIVSHEGLSGTAVIKEDGPTRVVVETSAAANSLLVLTDTFFPGWSARVDGVRSEILRADYMFRAIPIRDGRHIVEFDYRPMSLIMGAGISGVGVLILLFSFRRDLLRMRIIRKESDN